MGGSVLFYVAECPRLLDGFLESLPVLHMAGVIANPAVENVLQRVLAKELVAQDAHASGILEIHP